MDVSSRKEHLGYVFVRAIAYAAGFTVYRPEVDDDSIDLGIAARGPLGTTRSPRLELQVKCTGEGRLIARQMSYQLELKNYDDLRHDDCLVPRILVVATIPEDVEECVTLTDAQLVVRHCTYWCSLCGKPAYAGNATNPKITVHLPRKQKLDVKGLTAIMNLIGAGDKP